MWTGGSLCALQQVGDFGGGQARARFSVDLQDRIAGANSGLVCGRINKRRLNYRLIFALRNNHANSVIFAFLLLAEKRVLLGIEKVRVGIEHVKHAGDRAVVDNFIGVHRDRHSSARPPKARA